MRHRPAPSRRSTTCSKRSAHATPGITEIVAAARQSPSSTPGSTAHGERFRSGSSADCAVVATGTRAAGGRFEGVAPDAGIIACRTRFFDSELADIYDYLISLVAADPSLKLITTNSFGRRCGTPPPPEEGDFPAALEEATARGIAVFFSAGNNHDLAGGRPEDCHPSSIWQYKVRNDVFTVGACDLEGRIWSYSSRGPGQDWRRARNVEAGPSGADAARRPGGIWLRGSHFPEWLGHKRRLPAGRRVGGAALYCGAEPEVGSAFHQDSDRSAGSRVDVELPRGGTAGLLRIAVDQR
jgi:hypothetical protein